MPAIKLRIPKEHQAFYGGAITAPSAKERLESALAGLTELPAPSAVPSSMRAVSHTIWVSDQQYAALQKLNQSHRLGGPGPAASGLLYACSSRQLADATQRDDLGAGSPGAMTTLDRINAALGNTTRHDQARFYGGLFKEVIDHGKAHDVVFAEASTGIGKSRAFLAMVLDWLNTSAADSGAAVIAAPSYTVLMQLVDQWNRIGNVRELPDMQVLLGQQEFVSAQALERVLNENPDTPGAAQARAWLAGGGKASAEDPIGHSWSMRSLRAVTAEAWELRSQVALDTETAEDDPGSVAYRAQFKDGHACKVIFCTHAMLAVEVRFRQAQANRDFAAELPEGTTAGGMAWEMWQQFSAEDKKTSRTWELRNLLLQDMVKNDVGRLPPIGLLVVDEAHLLEQSFANAFATGTSMVRLMADLRRLHVDYPGIVLAKHLNSIRDAMAEFAAVGRERAAQDRVTVDGKHPGLSEAVLSIGATLTEIVGRLKASVKHRREARKIMAVKKALDIVARAGGERAGQRVQITWSPSYIWPSITIGRYDVSRELNFLWSLVVQDRSILVSATLFEDVSAIGLESMRRILSVSTSATRPLAPVRPSWLYDPVTLYMVGNSVHADGVPRFRRPSMKDRLDSIDYVERQERWRSDIATYVRDAYASAEGGVLVLMPSHAERELLVKRLGESLSSNVLLTQKDNRPMDAIRMDYLKLVAAGNRPCLVAVGGAWTGLDISGDGLATVTGNPVAPGDDNVLTDLVIPVVPFGTNHTLTHEWRRERVGILAEVGAVAILFRQGIGRLVRRDGLPMNRRLHFLDARIHESSWNSMLHPVTKALSRYTRRKTV